MLFLVSLAALMAVTLGAPDPWDPNHRERMNCSPKATNFGPHDWTGAKKTWMVANKDECVQKCSIGGKGDGSKVIQYRDDSGGAENCRCMYPKMYWINIVQDTQGGVTINSCDPNQPALWCAYPLYCMDMLHAPDWECMDGGNDCETEYKMNYMRLDWEWADFMCDGAGGKLASVPNNDVNTWIHENSQESIMSETWLGIEPGTKQDEWVNTDGTPYAFDLMLKGYPDYTKWEANYRVLLDMFGMDWLTAEKTHQFISVCSRTNPKNLVDPNMSCVFEEEEHEIVSDANGVFQELNECHFDMADSCACRDRCQEDDYHLSFQWKPDEAPNCCCYVFNS